MKGSVSSTRQGRCHAWRRVLIAAGALLIASVAVAGASDNARLPEPAYPAVVRLADAGKPTEALAELDRELHGREADLPLEALVLRTDLLCRAGQWRECAASWNDVGRREPALERLAFQKNVGALLGAGDARAALERLGPPSGREPARRYNDLRLAAATVLRAEGDARRAAALATAILNIVRKGDLADAALLELAAALESAGDQTAAINTLRRAARTFSDPHTFLRARDEERRLAGLQRGTPAPFSEADYATIARRLAASSRFAESNDVLMEWRRTYPKSSRLDDIDAAIVDNLYRLRANGEARAAADDFARRHPGSLHLSGVRAILFRLDVREGRTDEVTARGRACWSGKEARLPSGARWSVGFTLANYLVSVGRPDEGLSLYRELYQKAATRAGKIDALLRAAAVSLRAGDPKRAEGNLRSLLALKPTPATTLAATYWLAIARAAQGARDEAIASLQDLVDRAPYGYSGVRAAEELRALGVEPRAPTRLVFPDTSLPAATEHLPEYRAAAALARAGLLQDAASAARDLAARAGRDPAVALLAARASDAAGDYRAALRMLMGRLSPHLQRPSDGAPDDLLRLVYPRAFWDEVRPRAEAQRVDPLLMLAIMRRESRFDPGAVSPVGATGLFQIMAYTAEDLAPETGIERPDEDALLRPPANTAIAATLLNKLSGLFGGAVVPMIAAFNADEERVKVWWDTSRAGRGPRTGAGTGTETSKDEALFVETIPYAETRAYVKEVYANYVMYRRLYRP